MRKVFLVFITAFITKMIFNGYLVASYRLGNKGDSFYNAVI